MIWLNHAGFPHELVFILCSRRARGCVGRNRHAGWPGQAKLAPISRFKIKGDDPGTTIGVGKRGYTSGSRCGALHYEAEGEPLDAGYCYCTECQKASGSGFIPFIGFSSQAVRFSGQTKPFISKAANGGDAVSNFCPVCSSLVFGGEVGTSQTFTIYTGSLGAPSLFEPKIAIFARSRPRRAPIPPGLAFFQTMPADS